MTNKEVSKILLDTTYGTYVSKLFWIAANYSDMDNEIDEMLYEIPEPDWEEMFPSLALPEDQGDAIESLLDAGLLGFVAELHHPKHYNFKFDEDGKVIFSKMGYGTCRISYVYAETTEDLLKEIQKNSEKIYQEYIKKERG